MIYRAGDSSSNQTTFTLTTSSSTNSNTSGNKFGAYDSSYGVRVNDSADRGAILMEVDGNGRMNSILDLGNIPVGEWVSFKVKYNNGTWEVFIDGVSQGTVNNTTQITSSSLDYGIGSELDGTVYYDNIKIY